MKYPMKANILLAVTFFTGIITGVPANAESKTVHYGPRLEGFAYPHKVLQFELKSQGQTLEMSYMDVPASNKANDKTVVLLHGKNFCGATWADTISALTAKGFRVVAPDQIGFCKSDKPKGYQYSLNQLAFNTHTLLNSLNIKRPIIMGHSMGGMLAMRYALSFPQHLSQLILVNPIGLEDWQAKGVPYATIDELYANELKTSFDSIKNYQLKFYYNNHWKPEYDRWVNMQAGLYGGPGQAMVAMTQAQTSDMIFTQPVVHELSNIKAPTLLIIGGKDRTAPGANRAPAALRDQLGNYPALGIQTADAIPDTTLVALPALGHSPQVESPPEFHKVLFDNIIQ